MRMVTGQRVGVLEEVSSEAGEIYVILSMRLVGGFPLCDGGFERGKFVFRLVSPIRSPM